jgi:hypothetical protein
MYINASTAANAAQLQSQTQIFRREAVATKRREAAARSGPAG